MSTNEGRMTGKQILAEYRKLLQANAALSFQNRELEKEVKKLKKELGK